MIPISKITFDHVMNNRKNGASMKKDSKIQRKVYEIQSSLWTPKLYVEKFSRDIKFAAFTVSKLNFNPQKEAVACIQLDDQ